MSSKLTIHLLGSPTISLDNHPIVLERRKVIALLAYLAVTRDRRTREALSALFWPEYEQSKAFTNLRHTVWEVQKALGNDWLISNRETIGLTENKDIWVDIQEFETLLSESNMQGEANLRIPRLTNVTKLYRDHFLTGLNLKDAPAFNEWASIESEKLQLKFASALSTLCDDHCSLGQAELAVPYAQRLISLDPLNETSYRKLMEIHLQAGQYGAALKQYQSLAQILHKELNLEPQPETQALYNQIRNGKLPIYKPVSDKIAPRHNLPMQFTTFIGRKKEQKEIFELISKRRLVTLIGAGGIGKTRLALQVGESLLEDFPNGVWFVTFESLFDPTLVPQTVAAQFNIQESSDKPLIERLSDALHDKNLLLILDNCEHLHSACERLIETLLRHCPKLKLLVTSREVIGVTGETSFYVRHLSVPDDSSLSVEKSNEYESIQLFTARAQLALSTFTLTNKNIEAVKTICQHLDGIPLAIELAAARVDLFQPKEILKQLDSSLSLLTNDHRPTHVRHHTLRASMEWSWALLNEQEQTFIMQASMFAGGWTFNSAEVVCDGDTLKMLDALAKKSLIVVNHEAGSETRYIFHKTMRQYAREKLAASGMEAMICKRHLDYFLRFSEDAEIGLKNLEQDEWQSRIKHERDNIRTALEFASKNDIKAGLYLSSRLYSFGEFFDLPEGIYWITKFIENNDSDLYPQAKAAALCSMGWSLQWLEQFEDAMSAARECLHLFRTSGDKHGEVEALTLLGTISNWSIAADLEPLRQALTLSETLGDKWRQARVLGRLGQIDGRDQQSRFNYWEKAISLFKEVGDMRLAANYLCVAGFYHILNNDLKAAQKKLDEAVTLTQQLEKKGGIFLYTAYGRMAIVQRNFEKAHEDLQKVVEIAVERGNKVDLLWIRSHLGHLALHEGDLVEARSIFTETARKFLRNNYVMGVVFSLEGMANIHASEGNYERAACLIGWADKARTNIPDTRPLLEQGDVDQVIAAITAKIGNTAFEEGYASGQEMTLEDAVMLALKEN